jgi:rhodanese-related sulfurtransferase
VPQAVDREELQRLVREERAQLVEVLPKEEYDEEHLPGAISIPLRQIDREARDRLDPSRPVIVYCWDDP